MKSVRESLNHGEGSFPAEFVAQQGRGEEDRTAFVLSGGGNRGALQVGALIALLEAGIQPRILLGSSVGAINATAIAVDPTLQGAHKLKALWKSIKREEVFPDSYIKALLRLVRGKDSLFSNQNLRRLVESHLPPGIQRFGDISTAQLYVVALNINTGHIHIFGRDPSESIVDAIMASAAIPPYFDPWYYRGWQYVDGGAAANLPLNVALEAGATEIYAIDVSYLGKTRSPVKGIFHILSQTVKAIIHQQFLRDLRCVAPERSDIIHHIPLEGFQSLSLWDFSRVSEMIEEGKGVTEEFLREHLRASVAQ